METQAYADGLVRAAVMSVQFQRIRRTAPWKSPRWSGSRTGKRSELSAIPVGAGKSRTGRPITRIVWPDIRQLLES
jgi:hypothetical protein